MTCRKMKAMGHAILDIHGAYEGWLNAYGVALNEQWGRFRTTDAAAAIVAEKIGAQEDDRWWVIENGQLLDHFVISAPLHQDANGVELFDGMRKRAQIAEEMHRLIGEQAGHRAVAAMMRYVDHTPEPSLERLDAERRAEQRRQERAIADGPGVPSGAG